jgi:hypothetical protein
MPISWKSVPSTHSDGDAGHTSDHNEITQAVSQLQTEVDVAASARDPHIVEGILDNDPPTVTFADAGKRWVVGSTPTGAWVGMGRHYVLWDGSAWVDEGMPESHDWVLTSHGSAPVSFYSFGTRLGWHIPTGDGINLWNYDIVLGVVTEPPTDRRTDFYSEWNGTQYGFHYIVAATGATGLFAGQENQIARFHGEDTASAATGGWVFSSESRHYTLRVGQRVFVLKGLKTLEWSGTAWVEVYFPNTPATGATAGQVLAVNADADGYEAVDAASGGGSTRDPHIVEGIFGDDPPTVTSADAGKRWVAGSNPTGAWVGMARHVVLWDGAAWVDEGAPIKNQSWVKINPDLVGNIRFTGHGWHGREPSIDLWDYGIVLDVLTEPRTRTTGLPLESSGDYHGTKYLVAPTGATGVFAGHENKIATYYYEYAAAAADDGWYFPHGTRDHQVGDRVFVLTGLRTLEWTGTAWVDVTRIARTEDLPDVPMTVGALRALELGTTYKFPTTVEPLGPGSSLTHEIAKTGIVGLIDRGHPLINARLIRIGANLWQVHAEEFSGSTDQPSVSWTADIDPDYGDHTGVGGSPAVSFTNVLFDLRREIGDGSQFGSSSIVGKIVELEKALDAASVRIATLETTGSHVDQAHGHAGVVADFPMPVNAQGTHYLIITDDKAAPEHIGKDLLDEQPHKVSLDWKVGFDPHNVEGVDWDVHPPAVWLQSGQTFKQLIDPVTSQVLSYAAIKSFVEGSSVITLVWDATATIFKVMKVEHGTVIASA